MSEEVYFNEPSYEGMMGTPQGDAKNEGYSNIVRLCNVKWAMVDQIKNPSKGFEQVIRRHFYIKRDVVLKECGEWVKKADKNTCDYSGLIEDHNSKYAYKFKKDKSLYKK